MSQDLSAYFESQREWMLGFLTGLLAIKSVSGQEQEAGEYLAEKLGSLGARCEKTPISNDIRSHPDYSDPIKGLDYSERFNLILAKEGGAGKTITFNSHFDVVPPSPGQSHAYEPRLEGGILKGRGACDAKGQIALMALLMKAACELPPLHNNLVCHMVVEEEFGGNGTLAQLSQHEGFHADALINLEPTDMRMMTSVRGAIWFDMCFSGVAGHAGSAGNTTSALYKAIAATELLRAYHGDLYARSKDYGLFRTVPNPMPLTIGQFNAGVWPSMVPGEARIRGVLGFLPNTTKQDVMDDIRNMLELPKNRWISDGMQMTFDYRHNGVELPPNHWLAQNLSNILEECGLDGAPYAMTVSTDAIFYNERHIPSVIFGPGSISDAHSADEQIKVDDILLAARILYMFARMV